MLSYFLFDFVTHFLTRKNECTTGYSKGLTNKGLIRFIIKKKMSDTYSFSLTTFSPSGKLVQIEYALQAVTLGSTSLGIKGK